MVRTAIATAVISLCAAAGAAPQIRAGGTPYALLSGRRSLWLLTCDRGCTGEARNAVGRLVRIDPRNGRAVASTPVPRPHAIAVGPRGVYALDFWRDRVRLIDPRSLQVARSLRLRLPFRLTPHDNAFLPFSVAVGGGAVWVATDRGALARADVRLTHVVATLRLPFDAFGGMAAGPHAVWVAESLAGVYRVDTRTSRVSARVRIRGFDATDVVRCSGSVLVLGARTAGGAPTNRFSLARLLRDRATMLTELPPGPLVFSCAAASLWLGRQNGSTVERIDPASGKVLERRHGRVGLALAYARGKLWTALPDGTVRQLGT